MGRSLDDLGYGMSWTDLRAVVAHLLTDERSALVRAVAAAATAGESTAGKPDRERPKYTAAQLRAAVRSRTT